MSDTPSQVNVNLPGELAKVWTSVGPQGFWSIIAGVVLLGVMSLFYYVLKTGQDNMQKSQEQLYQRLDAENRESRQREDKLLERADRQYKESFDRWDKGRDRAVELQGEVKALNTKVDVMAAEVKAVAVYLKLKDEPKEKTK
jgi:hypothetical protein